MCTLLSEFYTDCKTRGKAFTGYNLIKHFCTLQAQRIFLQPWRSISNFLTDPSSKWFRIQSAISYSVLLTLYPSPAYRSLGVSIIIGRKLFMIIPTLKKIIYLHSPKHELLNQLLIKSLNQPYYLVDSTKNFCQMALFSWFYLTFWLNLLNSMIDSTV